MQCVIVVISNKAPGKALVNFMVREVMFGLQSISVNLLGYSIFLNKVRKNKKKNMA